MDFLCQVAHLRAYALGFDVPEHGDCTCCKPGEVHDELLASARAHSKAGIGSEPVGRRQNPASSVQRAATGRRMRKRWLRIVRDASGVKGPKRPSNERRESIRRKKIGSLMRLPGSFA